MERQSLGADAKNENKQWIFQQVNHIFEPLMLNLVREKPKDHVSAFHDWSRLRSATCSNTWKQISGKERLTVTMTS